MKPGANTGDDDMDYFQRVGARIKHFRLLRQYSSYQRFAYEHNFNLSQYGEYEKGKNLTIESLRKILRALEVSHKEFFDTFEDII